MMELEKLSVPVPSEVWLSLVVGLAEVLQHTPFAGTEAPPSDVTFPPLDAVFDVIAETAVVLTVGTMGGGGVSLLAVHVPLPEASQ